MLFFAIYVSKRGSLKMSFWAPSTSPVKVENYKEVQLGQRVHVTFELLQR